MKTPFRLDDHPRRPQPLSAPPAGYFEQLPTRVMARLPRPAETAGRLALPGWLALVPPALRTGLASALVLAVFAASFWLGQSPTDAPLGLAQAAALDAVPRTQLVNYLLSSGEARVEAADLAEVAGANLSPQFLRPSNAELDEALDLQPADDVSYL